MSDPLYKEYLTIHNKPVETGQKDTKLEILASELALNLQWIKKFINFKKVSWICY